MTRFDHLATFALLVVQTFFDLRGDLDDRFFRDDAKHRVGVDLDPFGDGFRAVADQRHRQLACRLGLCQARHLFRGRGHCYRSGISAAGHLAAR